MTFSVYLEKKAATTGLAAGALFTLYDSDDLSAVPPNRSYAITGALSGGLPDSDDAAETFPMELIFRSYDGGTEITEYLVFPGNAICKFNINIPNFAPGANPVAGNRWRVDVLNPTGGVTSSGEVSAYLTESYAPDAWNYQCLHRDGSVTGTDYYSRMYMRMTSDALPSAVGYLSHNGASVGTTDIDMGVYVPTAIGGPFKIDEGILNNTGPAGVTRFGNNLANFGPVVSMQTKYQSTPTGGEGFNAMWFVA